MKQKNRLFENVVAQLGKAGINLEKDGVFEKKLKTASDLVDEVTSTFDDIVDEATEAFTEAMNEYSQEEEKKQVPSDEVIYAMLKEYYSDKSKYMLEMNEYSIFRDGALRGQGKLFCSWWGDKTGSKLVLNAEVSKNFDFWIIMHKTHQEQVLLEFIKEKELQYLFI